MCFWVTLPHPWTRLPAKVIKQAASEYQHQYDSTRLLLNETQRGAGDAGGARDAGDAGDAGDAFIRQEGFLDGLGLIYTLCNGKRDQPLLGWNLQQVEKDLKDVLPESIKFEVTKQVIPCPAEEKGKEGNEADDFAFLWDPRESKALVQAEDMFVHLGSRSKVLHYVMHVQSPPPHDQLNKTTNATNATNATRTTGFVDARGFGGICLVRKATGSLDTLTVDSSQCERLFIKHLARLVYGKHVAFDGEKSLLSDLRREFDEVQRVNFASRIAWNLRSLAHYAEGHFFAPIEERVLSLIQPAIHHKRHNNKIKSMNTTQMRECYFDTTSALYDPSLVSTGTIPNLHRLLLMCPYFLPLLPVLLRSLASSFMQNSHGNET